MTNLIDKLQGSKTYIVGVLIALVTLLQYLGYLTSEQAETLFSLLGATGLVTLRLGVASLNKKGKNK